MKVKKRILNHLKAARKEMMKFKERKGNILPLQQAGEKTYKAYVLLVEGISNKNIKTHKGVNIQVFERDDNDLKLLARKSEYLHTFWYEQGSAVFIKKDIIEASKLIRKLLIRYKVQ